MNRCNLHEVFRYPIARSVNEPAYLSEYLRYFDRIMPFVKAASIASPLVKSCFSSEKADFAFYTLKFQQLIEGIAGSSVSIFGKPQEIFFAARKGVAFFPVYDLIPELFALFRVDPLLESSRAVRFIDSVTTMLARQQPRYIVVWNDSLFLERLLVFCGRRAGLKSICIQHGLFHDSFDCRLLDGHYADYMFVWGEAQAGLYRESSFDKSKLRVLGYPYRTVSPTNKVGAAICLLGENTETTNKQLGIKKKHIYECIAALLQKNNFEVVYKPHPYERDAAFMPSNVRIEKCSLEKAMHNYATFIALTTTALLDATLHGRIAIQYYDADFGGSDFNKNGYSYVTRDIESIPLMIASLNEPSKVRENIILMPSNPAEKFLGLVNAL